MRKFRHLLRFSIFAAAGFCVIHFGRQLLLLSLSKDRGSRDGTSLAADSARGGRAAVSLSGSAVHWTPSGSVLAGLLRKQLGLLGLDEAWAEGLAAADASGFPDLLEKMKRMPPGQRDALLPLLLGRWAELDAAGGVEFFLSKNDEDTLSALLREWSRMDFPAAAAKAGEIGGKVLRRTLRDKALTDPAGLMAWMAGRPELNPLTLFDSDSEDNARALKALAETDPDQMLAWTRQVPEDKWGTDFIAGLAARLASRNPDDAIAWAKSLKNPNRSALALAGAAKSLAATDPDRAVSLLQGLPPPDFAVRRALYGIADQIIKLHPEKARELVLSLPDGEFRTTLMGRTLSMLLGTDPALAFQTVESLGAVSDSSDLYNIAKNPEEARRVLEAAEGSKPSSFRDQVAKQSLLNWMEKDPASLAGWLVDKMDTPLLASMKEALQSGLASEKQRGGTPDPQLLELIGLPPEALAKNLIYVDPVRAAADLLDIEDPEVRLRASSSIIREWVRMDRSELKNWAANLKDAGVQAAAWKSIAADWVKEDSWQASEWIAQLPEGKGRDSAVLSLAEGIQKTDPDLAWQWALSVGDPDLKALALSAAAASWRDKNPEALLKAMNEGNLTETERQDISEKLNPAAK